MLEDVLPAAIAAGAVAILVTVLIERYGGVVGGALGTVPTTIVPAVAGMASAQGDAELMESLSVVPAGMLVNAIFLSVWIFLPSRLEGLPLNRSLALTAVSALVVWAVVGTVAVLAIGVGEAEGPRAWAALVGLTALALAGLARYVADFRSEVLASVPRVAGLAGAILAPLVLTAAWEQAWGVADLAWLPLPFAAIVVALVAGRALAIESTLGAGALLLAYLALRERADGPKAVAWDVVGVRVRPVPPHRDRWRPASGKLP